MQKKNNGNLMQMTFPEPVSREMASVGQPLTSNCKPQVSWRSVCERDSQGNRQCKKDLKQVYLVCKKQN